MKISVSGKPDLIAWWRLTYCCFKKGSKALSGYSVKGCSDHWNTGPGEQIVQKLDTAMTLQVTESKPLFTRVEMPRSIKVGDLQN